MKKNLINKIVSVILVLVFIGSIIPCSVVSTYAASSEVNRINQQIKDTFTAAKKSAGRTTFKGWCALYVQTQLKVLGITSSKDTDVKGHGRQMYGNIKTGKTSKGYTKIKYQGNDCLKNLVKENPGNVYNVLISWNHQYGYSDSNPGYGHVTFIHAIIDGKVYFSESYGTSSAKEGAPQSRTIKSFMSSYNNSYGKAKGAVLFTKGGNVTYSVSALDAVDLSNESATIKSEISPTASVQKWGYYIGTNESEVRNVDGVTNPDKTHVDTKTMDWHRFINDDTNPQSRSSASYTVTNMFDSKKALQPETWYYYKFCVKVNNKWYQSGVKSFKTSNAKPGSTTLTIAKEYSDIGLNKAGITASWNAAARATKYHLQILDANEQLINGKTVTDLYGTTATCPADWFSEVGTYYVRLQAINDAGFTYSNTQRIDVHPDVHVTFYDTITKTNISEQDIHYGESATVPQIPTQTGYTFQSWEGNYSNVKSDVTINTIYKPNVYTVRFIDGLTGEIIGSPQKVEYNQKANAPAISQDENAGYQFIGWDKDFEHITEDTTITANYKWYDDKFPIKLTVPEGEVTYNGETVKAIQQAVKYEGTSKEVTGYYVIANVEAYRDDYVQGRLVVSLKSEQGLLLATTESAAFSLESGTNQYIRVFVPYDTLAHSISVYCVNSYEKTGIISAVVAKEIDNSENWKSTTNADEIPEDAEVISETHTEKVTQYSSRQRSTTTSYETSLSGWTRDGDGEWINQGQKTLEYAKFHSGFDTSNSLYKKYNKTPVAEYYSDNRKVVTDHTDHKSYIYWHWCEGKSASAPANHYIGWNKSSTYKKFHAFESTTKKDYKGTSYNAYVFKKSDVCSYNYNWNGYKSKTDQLTEVKTQYYTEYLKRYNYYKWSDWSEWTNTPISEKWNQEVRTQIVDGETITTYKYRSNAKASEPTIKPEQIVTLEGSAGSEYAGEEAVVFVYKYTQTADYTNEYISNTIELDSNGGFVIENARLREMPTEISGDFTIALSVKGCTESIVVGKIEAPKPVYSVTYYDFDGNIIYQNKEVKEGTTITEPDGKLLSVPEGYRFTQWDTSAVNVQRDLEIRPMSEKETYVVAFVDWGKQNVTLQRYQYGQPVIFPEYEEPLGIKVSWNTDELRENTEVDGDEEIITYTAYKDSVVTTQYENATYEIKFISLDSEFANSEIEPKTDDDVHEGDEGSNVGKEVPDEDIAKRVVPTGGASIELPYEDDESEEYIFLGWRNIEDGTLFDGNEVSEDGTYYPVYEFAQSVEVPVASVTTGEYTEEQTIALTCETENAVIFYSTDGTDPATGDVNQNADDPAGVHEYTGPITLTKTTTLKFCASALGMNNSGTVAELYAINTATSGVKYHLVTVYSTVPQNEGAYYQALIKDSTKLNTSEFGEIEGYTYEGLFYDETGEEEFYTSDLIKKETVLYAIYTPHTFTATFKDYDGTTISTVEAKYGTPAEAPVPTRAGYVFIGWDSEEYESLTSDKTFTAQYCLESEYATVTLSRSTMDVEEGADPRALKAKISPAELSNTELAWSSSNPEIVRIDNRTGLMEFLSEGTATVTVTVLATNSSSSCLISVSPNAIKSLYLSEGSILDIDAQRRLRRIAVGLNTVAEVKSNFANDENMLSIYGIDSTLLEETDLVGTGTVIKLIDGDTTLDEVVAIMTGDFNGDGKIQTRDISMMSQKVLNMREASEIQAIAVDVNGDGFVNVRDCAMMSRYLAGKEEID